MMVVTTFLWCLLFHQIQQGVSSAKKRRTWNLQYIQQKFLDELVLVYGMVENVQEMCTNDENWECYAYNR